LPRAHARVPVGKIARLMHLQFVESESTFAYFNAARGYLEAWGKPIAFLSQHPQGADALKWNGRISRKPSK
jgi:hypothetical protein